MFKKLVLARKVRWTALVLVVAMLFIASGIFAITTAKQGSALASGPLEKRLSEYLFTSFGRPSVQVSNESKENLVKLPSNGSAASGKVQALPSAPLNGATNLNPPAAPGNPADVFQLHSTVLLTDGKVLQPVGLDTFGQVGNVLYGDLHKIAAFFGYKVKLYKESGFYAVYRKDENASVFVIDTNFAHIHGEDVTTEGALVKYKDKVYAPLSAILKLEELSFHRNEHGDIAMNKEDFTRFSKLFPFYRTNPLELKNFARLLFFEARDGTILKKLAVASVVMNRVHSPRFHSTIDEVIFAPNQFPPAYYSSFPTLEPEDSYYEAARRVLNGENTVPECLFFNLVPFYGKEADFYKNIEGDYFYR